MNIRNGLLLVGMGLLVASDVVGLARLRISDQLREVEIAGHSDEDIERCKQKYFF